MLPWLHASGTDGLPAGPHTCNSRLTHRGRQGEVANPIPARTGHGLGWRSTPLGLASLALTPFRASPSQPQNPFARKLLLSDWSAAPFLIGSNIQGTAEHMPMPVRRPFIVPFPKSIYTRSPDCENVAHRANLQPSRDLSISLAPPRTAAPTGSFGPIFVSMSYMGYYRPSLREEKIFSSCPRRLLKPCLVARGTLGMKPCSEKIPQPMLFEMGSSNRLCCLLLCDGHFTSSS
jgi:hypothetical protein